MGIFKKDKAEWSWSGLVAVLISAGLVGGWTGSVIIVALKGGSYVLPDSVVQSFEALGQTLAGGLIGYLGARAMHSNESRDGDPNG